MPQARPLEPSDPDRLGGYPLRGRLGQGGQGMVFLGRDVTGGPVAVKMLHARLADAAARSRFIRELEAAKDVPPFCTARVLDAGLDEDRPYVVEEYVEGPSLKQLVAEEGVRGSEFLERLATGTASALAAIHQAGVMHRDFKPANVLLGTTGPRVNDFGLAAALDSAATVTDHPVGTPAFMAPEQLSGSGVGPAADVFAWGATMLFAATGSPPFGDDADSASMVTQRVLYEQPDLRALPEWLRDTVTAALSKDATRRPSAYHVLIRLLGLSGSPDPMVVMTMGAEGRTTSSTWLRSGSEPPAKSKDAMILPRLPQERVWEPTDRPPPDPPAHTPVDRSAGNRNRRRRAVTASLVAAIIVVGIIVITLALRSGSRGGAGGSGRSAGPIATHSGELVNRIPAGFAGTWQGTAVNQRGVRFPVQVTFVEGRTTAAVRYPAPMGCNGTLTVVKANRYRLYMALKIGRPCTGGGTVIVTRRTNGSLGYLWSRPGSPLRYRATLNAA